MRMVSVPDFHDRTLLQPHLTLLTPNIVYYFRWIIHNYATPYAVSILKNLIPALKPGARIIINDQCLREPGSENPWDERIMRTMDMVMLSLLNAQERTEIEFKELFKAASEGYVFKVRKPTSYSIISPSLSSTKWTGE
jgi:hypothetical protein